MQLTGVLGYLFAVGVYLLNQRRAHHCPALSSSDGRAELGLIARRVEQTLICGVPELDLRVGLLTVVRQYLLAGTANLGPVRL